DAREERRVHRPPATSARGRAQPPPHQQVFQVGSGGRTYTCGVKRIALLGATGSIGRQAVEVIDANPGLELAAAASGSQPIDGLAPLTQVGGDLVELLDRSEPDIVLNAVVGF